MKTTLTTILILLSIGASSQMTINLKPDAQHGKDTELPFWNQYLDSNYGDIPIFVVAHWTINTQPGTVHSLIDFDWSNIPPNAIVSNAKMKVYAYNGDGGYQEFHSTLSGSNESWIERIITPWDELTITPSNPPSTTTLNRVSVFPSDSINHDFEIDVTQLVTDILSNPNDSYGFYWRLQLEQGYRRLGFCTSDNSDPSKWPEITITFEAPGVTGKVFHDLNQNCTNEANELGLANHLIEIQPGNIVVQTNEAGIWHADLAPGNYVATLIGLTNGWSSSCSLSSNFTVNNTNDAIYIPEFGVFSDENCTKPTISIYSNILRRCFSEQEIYVSAANTFQATDTLTNAYADIVLDPLFTVDSATLAYTALGNSTYRFDLASLLPGETKNFTIYVTLSCDAVLLETLCHEAYLYPVEACVLDTIPSPPTGGVSPCTLPWDQSSLSVDGWCANDSVYFTITNTGNFGGGDMECYAPVRIYVDGQLIILDSIMLVGGETVTYVFAGTGQTWILQADQHPLHPGNSHPNAHVELCGDPSNWTPDIIGDFPQDDADPIKDVFCTVTNGSYDPNDKRGFPSGITENNYILPNQELEYIIRFQNTGTDTAFTVVVRDTLDTDLDITSLVLGNSSHNYSFRIYGPRVLEWRFDNILLVDSTTNEPGSHGFIQFTVKQHKDLPIGTVINNEADIYFDFNVPVITNNATHIINIEAYETVAGAGIKENSLSDVSIYPNPVSDLLTIKTVTNKKLAYTFTDLMGKKILNGTLKNSNQVSIVSLKSGIYILNLIDGTSQKQFKIVKN